VNIKAFMTSSYWRFDPLTQYEYPLCEENSNGISSFSIGRSFNMLVLYVDAVLNTFEIAKL